MKQRYPWPASQLDEKDMEKLYLARKNTGKPMTMLIKEAVNKTYNKKEEL